MLNSLCLTMTKSSFLGIRLTEDEEKIINDLINSGKAKNRREAYEIMTVAKYMKDDIENTNNDIQENTESHPGSKHRLRPAFSVGPEP